MSNKTQLQTNNTKYASLIELLRGKAAGGSSIATCTIIIDPSAYQQGVDVGYTNGSGVGLHISQASGGSNITLSNVMCGSMFTIVCDIDMVFGNAPTTLTTLRQGRNWAMCKAPTTSGTYTYSIVDDS